MIKPMDVTPNVISALRFLRTHVAVDARPQVAQAFHDLEDAGAFAEIDEVADGDAVPGLLADSALIEIKGA